MRSLLRLTLLFAIMVGAVPASAQVWNWSQTPANNATIDPNINWAEGMPPSAVNDSARATLAGIAKNRDDHSGLVTLSGGPTAYTATTNQPPNGSGSGTSSLIAGYQICFAPNVTNGATVTLAIDSQAAKPLRSQPATELVGGEFRPGAPYCATFFTSNGGEYILNSYFVPAATSLSVGSTPISGGTANDCLSVNAGGTTLNNIPCVTSIGASQMQSSALSSFAQPVNLQLNATVASNQLTFAIKGVNGSDPSANNPVLVGFRSQTTNAGTNIFGSIQAATSFTLATTSSMGCTTGVVCRLWVELICQTESSGNCTSVLVGASLQSNTTSCFPLQENQLQSTGTGTTGGTSINTIFTSAASLSGKAIRIIGYVQATWTSGTGWSIGAGSAADPTVQVFSPGMHKPCDVLQTVYATSTGATTASTSTKVATNTTASITPTSALNLILARATGTLNQNSGAGGQGAQAQMGRNASTNLFGSSVAQEAGASGTAATASPATLEGLDAPATTASTTYTVYLWEPSGASGVQWLGSVNTSTPTQGTMVLQEIMG